MSDAHVILDRMLAASGRTPSALMPAEALTSPVEGPVRATPIERLRAAQEARKQPPTPPCETIAAPIRPSLTDQRANVVEWAKRDPANAAILIEQLGLTYIASVMKEKRSDLGAPMPERHEVTAAQCSLFDNWPTGKKPNKNHKGNSKGAGKPHYQCEIEMWTVAERVEIVNDVNSAFQALAPLLDHAELVKRVKTLREMGGRPWRAKHPDDRAGADLEAFGNRLLALSAANPGKLYGPVFSTSGGTKYYQGHYVCSDAATIGTSKFEIALHREGFEPVVFRCFASTYSNGAKLAGNVVAHSRISRRADHSSWRTANV